MGVHGLWKILEQTADPVKLETLRGKTLAIDASIWIYHFLKAMRDPKGTVLIAAHVIGFFRRICKLMFFEIKPVFVFDGAAPLLKKQTTHRRSERRVGREQTARSTANKLLTIQLQRAAKKNGVQSASAPTDTSHETEITGSVPRDAVYFDDLVNSTADNSSLSTAGSRESALARAPQKQFIATDQYHLPEMDRIGPIRTDDQRLLTEEELEEYGKQFTSQARAGFIDTSLVDFKSKEFELLPVETQYQLLNMARMKSRLRMGYTTEQLNDMFPDEMEFSKFQINRVAQRNFFTQKLINLMGMEEDLTRRVSSEKNKEYMLKKNDQGWSLSLGDDPEDQKQSTGQFSFRDSEPKVETPAVVATQPAVATQLEDSSESELEFEEVDLSAPKKNDANTDTDLVGARPSAVLEDTSHPSPPTSHNEPKLREDGALGNVDQLFGFEARLSRDSLYDRIAFNMDSEDDDDEPPAASATQGPAGFGSGGGARSMLFGKSAKDRLPNFDTISITAKQQTPDNNTIPLVQHPNERTRPIEEPASRPLQKKKIPNDRSEKRPSAKSTAPAVPWFEEQGNFDEMRIQEREQENFVPLDYEFDEEPRCDQSLETRAEKKSDDIPGSDHYQRNQINLMQKAEANNKSISEAESKINVHTSTIPDIDNNMAPSTQNKGTYTQMRSVPTVTSSDHYVGLSDRIQQTPEAENETLNHKKPHSSSEDLTISKAAPEDAPSPQVINTSLESDDSIIELSPEEAARAEEDAKAKEEEEEDIAGMLIAEAEENERFAKELADQANQSWSQANERDYQTQISQLRGQFAKASRDADNVTSEMIQECQELLQLFGIPYVTAPGEAEAQCATLHSLKLVDGVVTDDGDTFLFDDDAKVYRNMFSQAKFVEFYSTKRIHSRLGLDRSSMIDLAFLLGSDYTDGVLGIGPVTGVEILAEFGNLRAFAEWWSEAQRFPDQAEVDTSLKRRLVKNFQTKLYLPDEFPDPVVVHAYTHPAVDKNSEKFSWGIPDLDGLRRFMESTAGWDVDKTDATLLPVVQESRRRELLNKTEKVMNQSRLEDYYQSVVQNPALGSKRAARAAGLMRKRQKK